MAEVRWFPLCGPDGVGKTAIGEQFVLRRIGIRTDPFFGFPVTPGGGKTLYLACDRPRQALRSFRRMVTEDDRDLLDRRLIIWAGPLPFDLVGDPKGLLILAEELEADTVVIDSLKDVAPALSDEECGQRINNAFQTCVSSGVEVFALRHQRKQQSGGGKPRHISDVYASRWITAGCGSIVMLWGEPGDLVVDFDHIKQPRRDNRTASDRSRSLPRLEHRRESRRRLGRRPERRTGRNRQRGRHGHVRTPPSTSPSTPITSPPDETKSDHATDHVDHGTVHDRSASNPVRSVWRYPC